MCTEYILLMYPPNLVSDTLVRVAHRIELPTEHTISSPLSTSTPLGSLLTSITGLTLSTVASLVLVLL